MIEKLQKFFPKKSFNRNFLILLTSNIMVSVLGMLTSIYIARVLSPENYGIYGVYIAYVGIFQVLASLGLSATITREVARNQNKSLIIFRASVIAYTIGFFLAFIAFHVYYFFGNESFSYDIKILLLLSLFSLTSWTLFENIAFGMQRMEFIGIIKLIVAVILLLVLVSIPEDKLSVVLFFSLTIASQFVRDVIFYFALKRYRMFLSDEIYNLKQLFLYSKKLIIDSIPFLIMGLFSMLSNQFPILFLNDNSGAQEVAFYNVANKLLIPMTLVITTALSAIYPNLSKLFELDKTKYINKIRIGFNLIAFIGLLGGFVITLFGNEIVYILFGNEYANTGKVMAYQVWYLVFFSFFGFIGGILSSSDKQKELSILSIFYAAVSVPFLWYGSMYGAIGLSIAFIIASCINLSYHWYFMNRLLPFSMGVKYPIFLFTPIIITFIISINIPANLTILFRVVILLIFLTVLVFFYKKKFIALRKLF